MSLFREGSVPSFGSALDVVPPIADSFLLAEDGASSAQETVTRLRNFRYARTDVPNLE